MEELRLDKTDNDRKSGSPKTSATIGNLNTSQSNFTKNGKSKKKNKKLLENERSLGKSMDSEATRRIEDPTGPVDLQPNDNVNDTAMKRTNLISSNTSRVNTVRRGFGTTITGP